MLRSEILKVSSRNIFLYISLLKLKNTFLYIAMYHLYFCVQSRRKGCWKSSPRFAASFLHPHRSASLAITLHHFAAVICLFLLFLPIVSRSCFFRLLKHFVSSKSVALWASFHLLSISVTIRFNFANNKLCTLFSSFQRCLQVKGKRPPPPLYISLLSQQIIVS